MNFGNKHRQQIIELLLSLKNTTLVVVSNDEEFARQCNRTIVMNENGSINN